MRSNQPPLCNAARSAQLPGIPPLFLMLVTFYPRHKETLRKWTAGIPNRPHPPESNHSSVTWGFLKFPRLWGCSWHWWVSWLLSTVLVVSLGWPQPGSGRGPGLSDVITSFIDGCHCRICMAPPRSSHTLTATPNPTDPPTLPSLLLSIGHSTGPTHTQRDTHRYTHPGHRCLFCILDGQCTGWSEWNTCAERGSNNEENKDGGSVLM